MRNLTTLACLLIVLTLSSCGDDDEPSREAQLVPVMRSLYHDGLMPRHLVGFSAPDTDTLLVWLADPTWREYWRNVVLGIGYLGRGEDGDVTALMNFLGRPDSTPLTGPEYAARQNVLRALGYIVYRSGNAKALATLLTHSEPSAWSATPARLRGWTSPYGEEERFLRTHFARLAILGLGQTGTTDARDRLTGLRDPDGASNEEDRQFRIRELDIINTAHERNEQRLLTAPKVRHK